MVRMLTACAVIGLSLAMAAPGRCGEIILPQGRGAFYADEAIELAVAGLARGQSATIAMVPQGKSRGWRDARSRSRATARRSWWSCRRCTCARHLRSRSTASRREGR